MVVRRIGALSLGKVMGILYALMGLIIGVFFVFFSLLSATVGMASSQSSDAVASLLFSAGSVNFLPNFYGISGFVFGLITALLYKLVARLVGGIQIELVEARRPGSAAYHP